MFALYFAFKNVISRKSSFVIVLFVAFALALLVMSNAVFDGTRTGIEKTFSNNFTGDVVIRPYADFPMSLFGDETPVTGSLSELPQIVPFSSVYNFVRDFEGIQNSFPQITGQAVLLVNRKKFPFYFFGVNGNEYLNSMKGIKIIEGAPYKTGKNKIMISTQVRAKIQEDTKKKINVGDTIQLVSSNGSSYNLRSAEVSAIYEYSVQNDLQDKIVLIDPTALRSLIGLESTEVDESLFTDENSNLLQGFDSIDNLDDVFSSGSDTTIEDSALDNEIAQNLNETAAPLNDLSNSTTTKSLETEQIWNYIVCDIDKDVSSRSVIRQLNKEFSKREWRVQAVNWRTSAGMSAQYIYWMRLIFNIGILIILATGFIVVNNTLIISALDRTTETGVLRAIGAGRKFVALEYLLEVLIITLTAGVLGCFLGAVGNSIFLSGKITFSNTYLIQLFGGTELKTNITFWNILGSMILSVILALIGWIYPVRIALETSPVVAMESIR